MWQGYFVEAVILVVALCIITLRGAEYALAQYGSHADDASALHYPLTAWLGQAFDDMSESSLHKLIWITAAVKIVVSMTWLIVLALNTSMGVAWHRFTVWFNIWYKRNSDGGTALGALQPMMAGGVPIDFENIEDLDEDTAFGIGKIEDFTWKGMLDFASCTECGRCQSQCPAWNTEKPLSPKLLVMGLRDHAFAKAPYLKADRRPTVATCRPRPRQRPSDPWSVRPKATPGGHPAGRSSTPTCCGRAPRAAHVCSSARSTSSTSTTSWTCGATRCWWSRASRASSTSCSEALRTRATRGTWRPTARMDWAKGLPFDVKQVGVDVASLDEVEWLFWVGCAGAYEDRAKKTTRAVAELLQPGRRRRSPCSVTARRARETLRGARATSSSSSSSPCRTRRCSRRHGVTKVVSTCAHCFNTLKNEYGAFGVELEVVHHTQLLNRLVRDGRLTPVAPVGSSVNGRTITYHDPCYLGRHNQVYEPPRELLAVIPGAELKEMPRNTERSFCCGGGGARMWMEEKIGERINANRTAEAVATGASQIAVACPFCRVMLSDGLTAMQAAGTAGEEVEVLDVAQLLLASVNRGTDTAV